MNPLRLALRRTRRNHSSLNITGYRRPRNKESGVELIEFALVFPLLLLVILGVVDFGFLFQRWEALTNAAREGARVATLPGYETVDVEARVASYLAASGVPTTGGNPAVTVAGTTIAQGAATWPATTVTPFLHSRLPLSGQRHRLVRWRARLDDGDDTSHDARRDLGTVVGALGNSSLCSTSPPSIPPRFTNKLKICSGSALTGGDFAHIPGTKTRFIHSIGEVDDRHMTPFLPELSIDGLVLWRVRRESHQQLWCSVSDFAGEFALTVNNLGTGQVLVAEAHEELAPLMNRVWGLRDQFVSAGWDEVDVDFDEPD